MNIPQVGYISMQVQESQAVRMARVPGYVKTFCEHAPTQSELARFHARLGFQGPGTKTSRSDGHHADHG